MENAVSSCRLCGGLLKPQAKRCSTCGADLSLVTVPDTSHTSDAAGQSLCDTTLSEKLVPLNKKRKIFGVAGGILFGCGIAANYVFTFTGFPALGMFILASLLVSGALVWISRDNTSKKKKLISEHVVWAMLADNFGQAQYSASETFSDEQLQASGLRWKLNSGNDLFKTRYKGVSFAFSDVRLNGSVDRNDSQASKWQWLIIDLHREIPTPLMVSEIEKKGSFDKGAERQQVGGRFNVLCKSPDVTSQVLTSEFMNFLFIANAPQHLLFEGKTVHYGRLTGLDFFEPCKNVRDIPAVRERIQIEIDWIKQIIDGFLLIEYLFHQTSGEADS